jgi:hypothetical protein
MSWPTSGTRGENSAGPTGYPSGLAAMAAAGFLSPQAQKAMADLAQRAPVKLPTTPPVPASLAPNAVSRTAGAGLARGAGRFFWPAVAAFALYDLYETFMPASKGGFNPRGWTLSLRCGSDGDVASGMSGWSACGGLWYVAESNMAVRPTDTLVCTGTKRVKVGSTGVTWDVTKGGRYTRPTGVTTIPGFDVGLAIPVEWSAPDPWQDVDPMSARPGLPRMDPMPLPFRLLPYRVENPNRSPVEQPKRGNAVPLPAWEPIPEEVPFAPQVQPSPSAPGGPSVLPGERPGERPGVSPGWYPVPLGPDGNPIKEDNPDQAAPGRTVIPNPQLDPGEDIPGWVADPGVGPGVGPGVRPGVPPPAAVTPTVEVPTIRDEWPEGAVGPTIIIGGSDDIPVGPHSRTSPPKGTRERKSRRLRGVGSSLILRRGVNPVTEGLDALECVWKALPKKTRWDIQRADWNAQRAAGATPRPKAMAFGGVLDTSPAKLPLDWLGLDGQSMSVPGTGRKLPGYADYNANYILPLSPQAKVKAVYDNYKELDIDQMVKCMGANQIEDMMIGKLGQQLQQAGRRLGFSTGLGTGPTF